MLVHPSIAGVSHLKNESSTVTTGGSVYHILYRDSLMGTSRLDNPNELMGTASGAIIPGPAWPHVDGLRRNDSLVMEKIRVADEGGRLLNAGVLELDVGRDGAILITIAINDAEYWHRVTVNEL